MYYGELNREGMETLPENIKIELYHARLYEDRNTPMGELLSRYNSIIVDDKIYLTKDGKTRIDWLKPEDYVRNANGDYRIKLMKGVSCIIKEGKIIKNRYGWDYA